MAVATIYGPGTLDLSGPNCDCSVELLVMLTTATDGKEQIYDHAAIDSTFAAAVARLAAELMPSKGKD